MSKGLKRRRMQKKKISYSKTLTVKYDIDICIVGAGPAGIAAAISAARTGKTVMLFEAHTMSGGMGTAGFMPVFMSFTDGVNFLAGGIGREVYDRGKKYGALGGDGDVSINIESLKRLYEEMLLENDVGISYQTVLIDTVMVGNKIEAAIFAAKSGVFAVKSKIYIDCTGDGDMAFMAGAAYEIGDENGKMMPATLESSWVGVDWEKNRAGGAYSHHDEKMLNLLREANECGILDDNDYHHTGLALRSKYIVGANISHCFGVNPNDEISLTKGLIQGRKLLGQYERFYRKYVSGFADAELAGSGSLLGVRESRRITGGYVLCANDYYNRANFDDEIGRCNFGIDIHPSEPGAAALAEHKSIFAEGKYGKGESYGVPYRILCPQDVDNLLTAGRCVSADRYVMASIRIMPSCFITGMAAGTAAAIAVLEKQNPRNINIGVLQKNLKENGAFIPN
jgi:FAD-dependent oxidoreductase family protein